MEQDQRVGQRSARTLAREASSVPPSLGEERAEQKAAELRVPWARDGQNTRLANNPQPGLDRNCTPRQVSALSLNHLQAFRPLLFAILQPAASARSVKPGAIHACQMQGDLEVTQAQCVADAPSL